MTQPILSILIPSVVGRLAEWNNLLEKIFQQSGVKREIGYYEGYGNGWMNIWRSNNEVEILSLFDKKQLSIGGKREIMYNEAKGLYSWQIDDDDDISPTAIKLILEAIRSNPEVDVITFEEYVNIDGKEYKSNHSNEYADWEGDGNSLFADGFHFHRTPFFKSVIKTEIAKSVPIPHIRFGEDHQWAQALKPHIKSEIHIPEPLYRYIHISSNPTERYGLDK